MDVGNIPYEIIQPVLMRIENPRQLHLLEEASPQLREADEEIWRSFIKRDIPDADSRMLYPSESGSWWDIYCKMRSDYDAEAEEDAMRLKAAFAGIKSQKDERRIIFQEGTPHIPKRGGIQYAQAVAYKHVKKLPNKYKLPTSVTSFTAGKKTKVLTGKGVMEKARREAQDLSRRRAQNSMTVPTHKLSSVASPVREAPKHMVESFRKPSPPKPLDPTTPKAEMFKPPKRREERKGENHGSSAMSIEERERRLRALTNSSNAAKAATAPSKSISSARRGSSAKERPVTKPTTTKASTSNSPVTNPAVAKTAVTNPHARTPVTKPTASKSSVSKSSVMKPTTLPQSDLTPFSTSKPKPSMSQEPASSSTLLSTANLKRKRDDLTIITSTEVDDLGSIGSPTSSLSSPVKYRIPRLSSTPDSPRLRPMKKKAEVNIFMPIKKRRLS
ncbi:MAG: hypothetical protein Q9170_003008 [Blastenia crenularia]